MNRFILLFAMIGAGFASAAQVVSISPDSTNPGLTVSTVITLAPGIINNGHAPNTPAEVFLKQGVDTIFTDAFDSTQIYPGVSGHSDSLQAAFTIPALAILGWYEVHVITYDALSLPIDNKMSYGFLIFDPNSCPVPFNTTASNILETSAQINWDPATTADTFRIRYSVVGSGQYQWKDINGSGNPISGILTGLQPGTDYTFEVSTICLGYHSAYSIIDTFTTVANPVSCIRPFNLNNTAVTYTTADISWSPLVTADTFRIRYSVDGTSNYLWKNVNGGLGFSTTLSGLAPATAYQFQVSSICTGVSSGYSPSYIFITDGNCVVPIGVTASQITASSAVIKWSPNVLADTFRLRYRQTGAPSWNYKNLNGSLLIDSLGLNNLVPNTNYECQVSSVCNGTGNGYSSLVTFTTSNSVANCIVPFGISSSNVTNTTADINWSAQVNADTFRIRYAEQGTPNYMYVDSPGTSGSLATIGNMLPSTTYDFQVSSVCLGVSSGYSPVFSFTTGSSPASCITPYGTSESNITGTTADINWTAFVTADSFMVRYSVYPTSSYVWKKISGTGGVTSTTLSGLTTSTKYQWQVRSICSGVPVSIYSVSDTFTTAPFRMANPALTSMDPGVISVYPNPSSGKISISMNADRQMNVRLVLTDASGRFIRVWNKTLTRGSNTIELDATGVATGVYTLGIQAASFNDRVQLVISGQ